jgi:hypothetical protein
MVDPFVGSVAIVLLLVTGCFALWYFSDTNLSEKSRRPTSPR